MKSHFCKSNIFMALLSTAPLLIHLLILTCLFSYVQPRCHKDESTALLEFKDSFIIRRNVSRDPLAYPKVASWSPKEKADCCSWDGVECDESNTHVIALHLSSSCLHGSINSNNSLFRLSHLQILDLADNDFDGSLIPSELGNLSRLTYLNLSMSVFAGQIPSQISQLSNLSYLDLSANKLSGNIPQQLVQLTCLASFNVSFNHLSGLIPYGNQFSTFDSSPYKGNAGLWGYPLESLNTPKAPPPSDSGSDEDEDEDSKSWFKSNWNTILPGFVGGLIIGVAIEQDLAMDKREWFFKVVDFVDFVVLSKAKGRKGKKLRRTT